MAIFNPKCIISLDNCHPFYDNQLYFLQRLFWLDGKLALLETHRKMSCIFDFHIYLHKYELKNQQ